MTESMVERVARAISGAPYPSKASYRKARAAIEAMREPTEGMTVAGCSGPPMQPFGQVTSAAVWQAMIDHTLEKK